MGQQVVDVVADEGGDEEDWEDDGEDDEYVDQIAFRVEACLFTLVDVVGV